MFDELIVVKQKTLDALNAKAKVWLLGWVMSVLCLIVMGWMYYSTEQLVVNVNAAARAQTEQAETLAVNSEALIRAWEVQKKMQEALVDWAEFSSEKINIIDYNKTNKPSKGALTKRTAP